MANIHGWDDVSIASSAALDLVLCIWSIDFSVSFKLFLALNHQSHFAGD